MVPSEEGYAWAAGYRDGYADGISGKSSGPARREVERLSPTSSKPKRKVGKYQRVFGKKLKALKKKHPRTSASALMKRAHRETKKAMK